MNTIKLIIFLFIGYVFLEACNDNDTYCEKIAKYVAKNNAHFTKLVEGDKIRMAATFQPNAVMICKDPAADAKQYEGFTCFQLNIEDKNRLGLTNLIKNEYPSDEVESIINYYNFKLEEDVKLIMNQDTLPCTFCHHIQTGGAGTNYLFFMAFEAPSITSKDKIDLLIFDKIFSSSFYSLQFEGKQLSQLPTINN